MNNCKSLFFYCFFFFGFYASSNAASPDYDLVREAGDIKGVVTVCGNAEANVLIYAPGTSFSAVTDGGGNFKLSYVQQGMYDLIIKKGDNPIGTVSQITVVKKETVDIGTNNFCIDLDNDGYSPPQDCDDSNPAVNPVAEETCEDGIDNNCNGVADDGCTVCTDNDQDLFFAQVGCGTPVDCFDSDPSVNPQANEFCDGADNNCNGMIDESGANQTNYYRDEDEDGFGTSDDSILACAPPVGYVSQPGDCNDSDISINPFASEICSDGIDNNCNGPIDENCLCVDLNTCDDSLACTIDTCDSILGCTNQIAPGTCLINEQCYNDGAISPGGCGSCISSSSNNEWTPLPSTVECRASISSCDVSESCDGSSSSCPADAIAPNGTLCGIGLICSNGSCLSSTCTPNCNARSCGSDGCGGSCGSCGMGEVCDANIGQCFADTTCTCPNIYDPVCGANGITYTNTCEATCAEIAVEYSGECAP